MSRAQNRRTRYSFVGDRSWQPAAEPFQVEPEPIDHGDLRHGLDLNDLNAAASIAIRISNRMPVDQAERYDIAWCGAAEHLYASLEPVNRRDLVQAACRALDRALDSDKACHGVGKGATSRGSAPRFAAYWAPGVTPGTEERVVESLALIQIWPLLPAGQRRALAALAAHGGDLTAAAEALGMARESFHTSVKRGRARFRQLWHEGETLPVRTAKTGKALRARWASAKRRRRAVGMGAA